MKESFDYKESLIDIKASLFDIYEDQEKRIGELDDSLKNQYVNAFIEVKDLALVLLEKIQNLYSLSDDFEIKRNDDFSSSLETGDISSSKNDLSLPEDSMDSESKNEDNVSSENDNLNDDLTFISEDDLTKEDTIDENNSLEDQEINIPDENNSDKLLKYYLTCDEKELNFAYVSEKILEKMKFYQEKEEHNPQEDSSTIDPSKIYKNDDLTAKGIIVRNDQYMKLALSKHRQAGVLKEAKAYRIEKIRKKRQEEQELELEKAKVHLDI